MKSPNEPFLNAEQAIRAVDSRDKLLREDAISWLLANQRECAPAVMRASARRARQIKRRLRIMQLIVPSVPYVLGYLYYTRPDDHPFNVCTMLSFIALIGCSAMSAICTVCNDLGKLAERFDRSYQLGRLIDRYCGNLIFDRTRRRKHIPAMIAGLVASDGAGLSVLEARHWARLLRELDRVGTTDFGRFTSRGLNSAIISASRSSGKLEAIPHLVRLLTKPISAGLRAQTEEALRDLREVELQQADQKVLLRAPSADGPSILLRANSCDAACQDDSPRGLWVEVHHQSQNAQ